MADSIRERIIEFCVRALSGPGKPADLHVHRYRTTPLESDTLPATVVYLGSPTDRIDDESVNADHDNAVERELTFTLEHRVKAGIPDKALGPLLTWGTQAMMADQKCGGLAVKMDEIGIGWEAVQAAHTLGAAHQIFKVLYYTKKTDDTELPA
jgi:hypothetical protein